MTTGPDDEVLPEQSVDDTDVGWGDRPDEDDADLRRFLDERPPHHDRSD